ncbi:MAG: hypothetical protein ACFFDI_10710 [Promethearchaeota archaeon]
MQPARDIVSTRELSKELINKLFNRADELANGATPPLLTGKRLGTLFFEPSVFVRLTFESAMIKLGGGVLYSTEFQLSGKNSLSMDPHFFDMVKLVSDFSDVLLLRHPFEGSAKLAAEIADCPVINCGDTTHNPIQALVDLYTIRTLKNQIEGLEIGIVGNLKDTRNVKSFIEAISNFNVKICLVSREELRLSGRFLHDFRLRAEDDSSFRVQEVVSLEDCISSLDVLNLSNLEINLEGQKRKYVINEEVLTKAKRDLMIIPPMPRKAELPIDIETRLGPSSPTPFGTFFTQAQIGVSLAMAILEFVLYQK